MNASRILAIGAHPDDIEYGCLGTVLRFPEAAVKYVFLSVGSAGDPTSGERRLDESRAALGNIDTASGRDALTMAVTWFEPTLILTHSPHDTHQEHRQAHDWTLSAARRSQASILRYGTPSITPEFRPTLWVDIATTLPKKLRALACHKSQAQKTYMQQAQLDVFHASHYARLHGLPVTEAFEIERMFW